MELYKERTMLYNAVLENKWEAFDEHWEAFKEKFQEERKRVRAFYYENLKELCFPVSIHGDNIFHLAVYSGSEQPLRRILESVLSELIRSDDIVRDLMQMSVNNYGNTVLHEAAITGNLEAARLLVGHYKLNNLLEMPNVDAEETPLFIAAANGNTKVVKYLASQPGQTVPSADGKTQQLEAIHRRNKFDDPVLYVAVQGQHFGTALELLKLDEELANWLNKEGEILCLYLLANIPSALKSENQIGIWKKLVFSCLPASGTDDYNDDANDIEIEGLPASGTGDCNDDANDIEIEGLPASGIGDCNDNANGMKIKGFYLQVWNILIRVCSIAKNIWEEKRNHEFACELAKKLTELDKSWDQGFIRLFDRNDGLEVEEEQGNHTVQNILRVAAEKEPGYPMFADIAKIILEKYPQQLEQLEQEEESEIPLFAAIRAGNVALVKRILQVCPQQIERLNHRRQNILHLAAMYRQREIFDLVKSKEIAIMRMARQIDKDGYTVLHSVADTKHYKGGTGSGPAYRLQEELEWFSDVKKIIPSNYAIHKDNNNKTAEEILKEKHAEQLKNAQTWIKDTSQSCSAVAVLVATVVFAAAFTVPGGNKESDGLPVLLNSPAFLFFTTMDVIALSCSLTSVVMFLSILTSPFELENFRVSLPRRLKFGFALLFIAVAATMLAFTSTIFLIIRLDRRQRWMMTFIYSAAFFPVSVLALTHFALFVSLVKLLASPCRWLIGCLARFREYC